MLHLCTLASRYSSSSFADNCWLLISGHTITILNVGLLLNCQPSWIPTAFNSTLQSSQFSRGPVIYGLSDGLLTNTALGLPLLTTCIRVSSIGIQVIHLNRGSGLAHLKPRFSVTLAFCWSDDSGCSSPSSLHTGNMSSRVMLHNGTSSCGDQSDFWRLSGIYVCHSPYF